MDNQAHHRPPVIAAALLGWLLKDDWETPLGDYEEYYNDLVDEQGKARARWWYRSQVLRLLPDRIFVKLYWGREMFKSYFTLGLRNLTRNKTVSLINILGLSGAVGCTIAVFLFLTVVNSSDDFHDLADEVYLVGHTVEQFGSEEKWGTSPTPLGPAVASNLPQVQQAVRFTDRGATVRTTGTGFQEQISFADPGFFELFTFPLRLGNEDALLSPDGIIISHDTAEKYFRGQEPLGKEVVVTFQDSIDVPFTVRGVAEAYPGTPTFAFDFLLGYDNMKLTGVSNLEDWSSFTDATFLHIPDASNVPFVTDQLAQFIPLQNEVNTSWEIQSLFIENIKNPGWSAWQITRRAMRAPDPWAVLIMGGIALLTLLVASFNYINISLGFANRRLTEIGVRKTAGAEKKQLIMQLLTENLILCFVALLVGLLFAWLVVIPLFNDLFVEEIPLSFASNAGFWGFLVVLLAFLGLVSGAYPAFYISSFQPITILRGKQAFKSKKRLTHVLLTVQFALSLFTISLCTFIFSTNGFFENRAWGYDANKTLVVPVYTQEQYLEIRDASYQNPYVSAVSGASSHIGRSRVRQEIVVNGEDKEALMFQVGAGYLNTMSIAVKQGGGFVSEAGSEGSREAIVNADFVDEMGWTAPIGEGFRHRDDTYTVVGVIDDILLDPILGQNFPLFFSQVDEPAYQYVTVLTEPGRTDQVSNTLEEVWESSFSDIPYESFLQYNVFEEFYNSIRKMARNIGYLAFFSLLVSCMGLFGTASQKAAQHMKEVGVRKVLGAKAAQVVLLVNRSFLIVLIIATCITTPVCYLGLKLLISQLPIDIPVSIWPFMLANVAVFLMAGISLAAQTKKLITVNPTDILRHAS